MMNLENKTALVTGGAVRIGRAVCEALVREGCRVIIHCRQSVREAETLAARFRRAGATAWVVTGDLKTPGACERVMTRAFRMAGTVDFLINNAAVFHRHPWLTASDADWRTEWEINLAVPLRLIRALTRRMKQGKIINLLDYRVGSYRFNAAPYMLSKKALAELTALAAFELAPAFAVNAVAPGSVLAATRKRSAREKSGTFPLGRRPSVDDVGRAVVFLLQCDSITGQIMFVDSGQHLLGSQR